MTPTESVGINPNGFEPNDDKPMRDHHWDTIYNPQLYSNYRWRSILPFTIGGILNRYYHPPSKCIDSNGFNPESIPDSEETTSSGYPADDGASQQHTGHNQSQVDFHE